MIVTLSSFLCALRNIPAAGQPIVCKTPDGTLHEIKQFVFTKVVTAEGHESTTCVIELTELGSGKLEEEREYK